MGGNYNTNEVEIGTWIDGRKRYRKVVTGNVVLQGGQSGQFTIPTGLSASVVADNTVSFHTNLALNESGNKYRFEVFDVYSSINYIRLLSDNLSSEIKISISMNSISSANYDIKILSIIEYCKKS